MLTLPLAPLCSDDCKGPAPDVFPAVIEGDEVPAEPAAPSGEAPADPRWAALDGLRFDSPGDDG
jgi:uncharacterized metal-binding protein YceD (DUF177 family)